MLSVMDNVRTVLEVFRGKPIKNGTCLVDTAVVLVGWHRTTGCPYASEQQDIYRSFEEIYHQLKNQHGEKYKNKAVYKALRELDKLELTDIVKETHSPKKLRKLNENFFDVYNTKDDIQEQNSRVKANITDVLKACAAGANAKKIQTKTGEPIEITWPKAKEEIMKSAIVKEVGDPSEEALVATALALDGKRYTMDEVLKICNFGKSTVYNARGKLKDWGLVDTAKDRNYRRGNDPESSKLNEKFDWLYSVIEYDVSYDIGLGIVAQEENRKQRRDKELDQP